MKYLLILAPLSILAGCHKHDNPPPPPPSCLISQSAHTGTPPNIGPMKFTYDAQGRLSRTVESDTIITDFTYVADSIVSSAASVTGEFAGRTVIHKNKDGLATCLRATYNPQGTEWVNVAYEYNGQQLARSAITSSFRSDTQTTTFTWSAGNMVSWSDGTGTEKLEYYTNQPVQQGDAQYFDQFSQGFVIVRTKNLIRSRDGYTYTYDFRPDGKIASVTATDTIGETFITQYDYDCK